MRQHVRDVVAGSRLLWPWLRREPNEIDEVCERQPSSSLRARPRWRLHTCGSSPNAWPWSTASSTTRAVSSAGQPDEQPGVGAVAAADGEFVQQARHADVTGGEAAAAGPFDERAREEALADAACPGDDQIVTLGDPRAGAQRQDLLSVEPSGVGEVDGLEGGGMAQVGGAEPAVELALLAGRPLGVRVISETRAPVL